MPQADKLAHALAAKGWTVTELHRRLTGDLHLRTVQRWMSGEQLPTVRQAIELSRLFDCSVESLFDESLAVGADYLLPPAVLVDEARRDYARICAALWRASDELIRVLEILKVFLNDSDEIPERTKMQVVRVVLDLAKAAGQIGHNSVWLKSLQVGDPRARDENARATRSVFTEATEELVQAAQARQKAHEAKLTEPAEEPDQATKRAKKNRADKKPRRRSG